MKTIFEKSNGVVGIALTDKEEDLSFLDKKFVRNGNIGFTIKSPVFLNPF